MAASAASETRPPCALVALRRAGSPHRREQQDGVVENQVDAGLLQPARLEAGVVDDDATTAEEIGQYNQRARRNRTLEDHHGGALAVGELHGAQTVAGRRQPGRFHVEGEEAIARKSRFEIVQRGGEKPFEGGHTQATFSPYYFKAKILSVTPCKIFTWSVVNGVVLGVPRRKLKSSC